MKKFKTKHAQIFIKKKIYQENVFKRIKFSWSIKINLRYFSFTLTSQFPLVHSVHAPIKYIGYEEILREITLMIYS